MSLDFPLAINKCIVATCNLNQWALDFDNNLNNIIKSIKKAKLLNAKYRLGPELEVPGYSCEDHFLELDTLLHCDQSLSVILNSDLTDNIIVDIGCPILHNNIRYNCRVICLNRKILLIRPKVYLADDGNYREKRFFTSWNYNDKKLHDHTLSDLLSKVTGQVTVPFGIGVIATAETMIGSEICEELWTPNSQHIHMFLSGVEIIGNGSGSHHELRKLDSRLALITNATKRCGGAYLFANHQGCDGNRLYFDGSALISVNGEIMAQASQFSLHDVEVVTSVIDLDAIRSYRGTFASLQEQSSTTCPFPIIDARYFSIRSNKDPNTMHNPTTDTPKTISLHSPEEECALGPACWLWDYLRRSGAAGFLLPLSGGADSASVAAIVRVMCILVADAVVEGVQEVILDVDNLLKKNKTHSLILENAKNKLLQSKSQSMGNTNISEERVKELTTDNNNNKNECPKEVDEMDSVKQKSILANELTYQILHTVYMGTVNSSLNTQDRASRLADSIHCYHSNIVIDDIVAAILTVFSTLTGKTPHFESKGGTMAEDLALQNIQARIRMVMAYLFAQLFPWIRGNTGFLLVLSSGNVDEALRGYMTKYDCSSGDLNPIGGICKGDLKRMLRWIANRHDVPALEEIGTAVPTAELRPITDNKSESTQADEEEMGMTYEELGVFGYLRKVLKCGPVKMFLNLIDMWKHITPYDVAVKVKRFFFFYSVNRHKLTTLTPAYHAECYSPDDNRYDLRQFLYNTKWPRQFNTIDSILKSHYSDTAAVTEVSAADNITNNDKESIYESISRNETLGSTADSSTVFGGLACETISTNPSTAYPTAPHSPTDSI